MRTKFFWLARDNYQRDYEYVVTTSKPTARYDSGSAAMFWEGEFLHYLEPKVLHRVCDIRLKPGEGPIRVRLVRLEDGNEGR